MKKKALLYKKSLILLIVIANNALAQDAQVLLKGTQAPYTGLLIPEDKAVVLYNDVRKYKLLSESYEKTVEIYKLNESLLNDKSKLLMDRNASLEEGMRKATTISTIEKIGWFALGFLSVLAGSYAAKTISSTQ
jgi:hypothetical protein